MKHTVRISLILGLGILLVGLEVTGAAAENSSPNVATSPFSIGERLVYHVEWNPPWYLFFLPTMDAGEAELHLAGEINYRGRRALKIIFQARSSGTLVKLSGVKIDDHFEFLTDPDTFCTYAVSKKLREGKRMRDIDVVYYPDQQRLHIRELDMKENPPTVKRDEFVADIPSCVQDLFSALYSARRRSFSVGSAHRSLVGDNDRVKEIEVRVEKSETIQTPHGTYETWKLNTVALLGGLFKDGGQFNIWLTTDQRKMPVRFEAKVGLGKVSGKLKALEP